MYLKSRFTTSKESRISQIDFGNIQSLVQMGAQEEDTDSDDQDSKDIIYDFSIEKIKKKRDSEMVDPKFSHFLKKIKEGNLLHDQ